MIVGTIALLAFLFSGGANQLFFIDKIEKGVKDYVLSKERQKDILSELKETSKFIDEFNKERKTIFKEFKELYKTHPTEKKDLQNFFLELEKEQSNFQEQIIEDRISVLTKIEDQEWSLIIESSESNVSKRVEKELKKEGKNKAEIAFAKTRKSIARIVSDKDNQKAILEGLDNMIKAFGELEKNIQSLNVSANNILTKKDANKEALKSELDKMNEFRKLSSNQLVDFHTLVKNNTTQDEWDVVITSFTKELVISTR